MTGYFDLLSLLLGLLSYGILTYIQNSNREKLDDLDDLGDELSSLITQMNELKTLLDSSYSHKEKIEFNINKLKDALMDEFQRKINKDVCKKLIADNDQLAKTYGNILELKESLKSQNFIQV